MQIMDSLSALTLTRELLLDCLLLLDEGFAHDVLALDVGDFVVLWAELGRKVHAIFRLVVVGALHEDLLEHLLLGAEAKVGH